MAAQSGQLKELTVYPISGDTTVGGTHHNGLLNVTASSATITITLPAAATMPSGFIVLLRRNPASSFNVAIAGGVSDTLTATDTQRYYTTDGVSWIGLVSPAYALPTASASVLGGVKISTGLSIDGSGNLSVSYGSTSTTACVGNDSRLSDARTPTAHASTHASAGSDPITIAESQVTNLTTDLAAKVAKSGDTMTAPTSNIGILHLNVTAAANQIGLSFDDAGTTKWSLYKGTDNSLNFYNQTINALSLGFATGNATFAAEVKTVASATGSAGLNIPHGSAPTAPVNGDFWSTTVGFYGRVNGVTVGPFGSGGGSIAAFYAKIVSATVLSITGAGSATLNCVHAVSGTAGDYDITISGLTPSVGDVLGFYVKDWTAANKQFRLDAGGTVKIAGRTRYLVKLHTNVVLLQWDGAAWQPLVLNLDTPVVSYGGVPVSATGGTSPSFGAGWTGDIRWCRRGQKMEWQMYYAQASGGTAGVGNTIFLVPFGSIDSTAEPSAGGSDVYGTTGGCGNCYVNAYLGVIVPASYGTLGVRLNVQWTGSGAANGAAIWGSGSGGFDFSAATIWMGFKVSTAMSYW